VGLVKAGKVKGGDDLIYNWKRNMAVKAQDAGEFIENLEKKHGAITPKIILDESRSDKALLHKCFDWNDTTAAEKYRESQAGFIIRNLVVVNVSQSDPTNEEVSVRAFVSVTAEENKQYVSINTALADDGMREEVLSSCLSELKAVKVKYGNLKELAAVWAAIELSA
jgi:hypothetical protein